MSINNKTILGALAMDLKRFALGYHRGSISMAEKFYEEALKRKEEINKNEVPSYLVHYINKVNSLKKEKREKAAEDALLYSTLFQNASQV